MNFVNIINIIAVDTACITCKMRNFKSHLILVIELDRGSGLLMLGQAGFELKNGALLKIYSLPRFATP